MSRLSTYIIALAACAVLFAFLHLQRIYRARRWIRKQRDARLVSYQNNGIQIVAKHITAYAGAPRIVRTSPNCSKCYGSAPKKLHC
jgi:hypothetical protein